jgi:hypothetical protein
MLQKKQNGNYTPSKFPLPREEKNASKFNSSSVLLDYCLLLPFSVEGHHRKKQAMLRWMINTFRNFIMDSLLMIFQETNISYTRPLQELTECDFQFICGIENTELKNN